MQKSFSDLEYAAKKKLTRRDRFLAEIDSVMPWGKLHKLIEPFYPMVEGAGRPPIGLARMLRMYVAQQCFGLSDEGIEDAIYDIRVRGAAHVQNVNAYHRRLREWLRPFHGVARATCRTTWDGAGYSAPGVSGHQKRY
jgi:hypothetical protein